jgi:hypothetical protein
MPVVVKGVADYSELSDFFCHPVTKLLSSFSKFLTLLHFAYSYVSSGSNFQHVFPPLTSTEKGTIIKSIL